MKLRIRHIGEGAKTNHTFQEIVEQIYIKDTDAWIGHEKTRYPQGLEAKLVIKTTEDAVAWVWGALVRCNMRVWVEEKDGFIPIKKWRPKRSNCQLNRLGIHQSPLEKSGLFQWYNPKARAR